jgi:2'-5' RNA ligase
MQGRFAFADEPVWPRKRSEGLFFALLPDIVTARRIGRIAERSISEGDLTGRRLKNERLHVSLKFVGRFPRLRSKFVYAARLVGDAVSLSPFEVTFSAIGSFEAPPSKGGGPSKSPLVLLGEGEGLFTLHEALGAAMRKTGLRAGEAFVPHLTLLYGASMVPPRSIEPIRFTAREFVLIHSEHGLTRYHVLGRWPLGRIS